MASPTFSEPQEWQGLWRTGLPGPGLELSELRTSTIRTAPMLPVGPGPAQSQPLPPGLSDVSPERHSAQVSLLSPF